MAVTAEQQRTPVRICLLVRREPDPLGRQLVVLRDVAGARVYLGCVCDSAMIVQQWIELWVQDPGATPGPAERAIVESHGTGPPGAALSNADADRHWHALLAHDEAEGSVAIRSGWERGAPAAIFIDALAREPFHPRGPSGAPLVLCRDDALLQRSHLPAYSTSRHRYLFDPLGDARSPLVPASTGAPESDRTRAMADFCPPGRTLQSVNPAAAPMRVLRHGALTTDQLLDALGSSPGAGIPQSLTRLQIAVPINGRQHPLSSDPIGGWLLDQRRGAGHLAEVLHLKLRLLAEMIAQVRSLVARTARPMLNLRPESFRIDAPLTPAAGLPLLWTCRPVLVDPGSAAAIDIPAMPRPWFLADSSSPVTIYQPPRVSIRPRGRGKLHIAHVQQSAAAIASPTISLQASLQTADRIAAEAHDLLWLLLPLPQRVELYARIDRPADGSAPLHLTTIPQPMDPPTAAALTAAQGRDLAEVNFELLPALHAPCDLYSLAVLGLRILLHHPGEEVDQTLVELLSLARQAARGDRRAPLEQRVQTVLSADEALAERLGSHRLVHSGAAAQPRTADALPPSLWCQTLAMLVTMLSGVGPDSTCPHLAETDPDRPQSVFDPATAAASTLLVRSRSLLLIDWQYNRQVHAVVQRLRQGRS